MSNILEIASFIVAVVGVAYGYRESFERKRMGSSMFHFLRGVKTSAEGNSNNTGDTSAAWQALLKQIDDINRRLEKK
jgi:hypothetical protein